MKKCIPTISKIALILGLLIILSINAVAGSAPRITKEEVKTMLGNPEVTIVDVRTGKDWKASEYKIPGAIRVDPREIESWASKYSESQTFVLY